MKVRIVKPDSTHDFASYPVPWKFNIDIRNHGLEKVTPLKYVDF